MSDRDEIYDLMVRYGRGLDSRNVAQVVSCFTADAEIDYPLASKTVVKGQEEIHAFFTNGLGAMECAHHFSNFWFDIQGNQASYGCYVIARHWGLGVEPVNAKYMTASVAYHNRVVRTADGWRICYASQKHLWTEGDPSVFAHFD